MNEEAQRRIELAATLGLDPRIFSTAGSGRSRWTKFELDAYLHAPLAWSGLEPTHRTGRRGGHRSPGRRHEASPPLRTGEAGRRPRDRKISPKQGLPALGAAGKFLLSPEQAESERLESLDQTNLLHTGAEEPFDRIVSATRKFFNVGAASLSLIDGDAQHFKSVVGPLRDETPRQIALCTQTVERNSMLIINDALTDDRFASNPLVTGTPHIRFYAGYPLHGPRGWNIGTLCIIDQKPRDFPQSEQQVLRILAALAQRGIDERTYSPAR
ncbi:hypothetical protein QF031_000649 [Pseudarthrobacter defluvii]|uniref:GAF domain-containing protein n=1 Tax=Pseudarthrobacter defluvii TaxID=410837 RepID=UPI002780A9AE|nr:GAF domain-containing protein [Pseudarthrobacter defluvii]MDQ0767900.1 hypothetical protein [Pseudarthrobacter defluvii]